MNKTEKPSPPLATCSNAWLGLLKIILLSGIFICLVIISAQVNTISNDGVNVDEVDLSKTSTWIVMRGKRAHVKGMVHFLIDGDRIIIIGGVLSPELQHDLKVGICTDCTFINNMSDIQHTVVLHP